ncbi:DNA-nicking endonuclease, Smr domain [Desulfonatronum thiosulfatophilum]|uniref:DNA-nicking endonuclease, Smr domain n=1 Tax=Desulfonatronum thiosulfatophilum TaxID=617002 RepID=A0A1G6D4T3_9BACT|nr:Smr/MutS family protein [Desulfonatronum thiosulfatophilum]SDB40069.1 DNA-nicking endonuclease, Smr domain [Desulfonatronum thiosulfatophilum]
MKFNSLEDLQALKKKFPKKEKVKRSVPKQASTEKSESPLPRNDEDLFTQAMSGVSPISGAAKGRQVTGINSPTTPAAKEQSFGDEDIWVADYLRNLVQGNVDFELSYSEEYMHGYIQDLDKKILGKLKAGQFSVEAHLDMHGLNAAQARDAAYDFLRTQYHLGRRCVLLIPGRGKNSPGGQALIREELPLWLTREPLRRVVLAFCTAQPRHGGAGALYILLRKQKKTQGKVRWDLPASME